MRELNAGIDIVQALGGLADHAAADRLLAQRLDPEQYARLAVMHDERVRLKIANAVALCEPARVFINTGSDDDRAFVRALALEQGEEQPLPMPGHTIHYDLKDEQGRIIDRTYYVVNEGEPVSSLAQRLLREAALAEVGQHMRDIMRDRTMLIGFYMRGPVGAVAANPAIEITSSAYVVHSAEILYRNAYSDFADEVKRLGYFYTNLHSEGLNRPEDLPDARVFMDLSHRTTYSFNCTYAGNTLLLKKGNHRFSVDRAVYQRSGRELAEHMFITGMEGPGGRVTWIAGAAPSGCGKTTTAMAGDRFVGDDLAQMWIAADGTVRSINPECGIFGIVRDVNHEGDPLLMERLRNPGAEVIWSNVLIDDNGVPRWTGDGDPEPGRGRNFQGQWVPGQRDADGKPVPISHPNARCTIASTELANYSDRAEDPAGVATRIITYSGRDSDTMPPVWAAPDADHGVAIGACIVSAATATEVGATGVNPPPRANPPINTRPQGALGDYLGAQFDFFNSDLIADDQRPVMAGLNYFLTHAARGGEGDGLLGEKRDVKVWLSWLERRVHDEVAAIDTPVGWLPLYDDLRELFATLIDKEYPEALYQRQFSLYIDNIVARIDMQAEAYRRDEHIPERLFEVLKEQKQGLLALRERYGAVVTPAQLAAN